LDRSGQLFECAAVGARLDPALASANGSFCECFAAAGGAAKTSSPPSPTGGAAQSRSRAECSGTRGVCTACFPGSGGGCRAAHNGVCYPVNADGTCPAGAALCGGVPCACGQPEQPNALVLGAVFLQPGASPTDPPAVKAAAAAAAAARANDTLSGLVVDAVTKLAANGTVVVFSGALDETPPCTPLPASCCRLQLSCTRLVQRPTY
jgi:hypothetical protein